MDPQDHRDIRNLALGLVGVCVIVFCMNLFYECQISQVQKKLDQTIHRVEVLEGVLGK